MQPAQAIVGAAAAAGDIPTSLLPTPIFSGGCEAGICASKTVNASVTNVTLSAPTINPAINYQQQISHQPPPAATTFLMCGIPTAIGGRMTTGPLPVNRGFGGVYPAHATYISIPALPIAAAYSNIMQFPCHNHGLGHHPYSFPSPFDYATSYGYPSMSANAFHSYSRLTEFLATNNTAISDVNAALVNSGDIIHPYPLQLMASSDNGIRPSVGSKQEDQYQSELLSGAAATPLVEEIIEGLMENDSTKTISSGSVEIGESARPFAKATASEYDGLPWSSGDTQPFGWNAGEEATALVNEESLMPQLRAQLKKADTIQEDQKLLNSPGAEKVMQLYAAREKKDQKEKGQNFEGRSFRTPDFEFKYTARNCTGESTSNADSVADTIDTESTQLVIRNSKDVFDILYSKHPEVAVAKKIQDGEHNENENRRREDVKGQKKRVLADEIPAERESYSFRSCTPEYQMPQSEKNGETTSTKRNLSKGIKSETVATNKNAVKKDLKKAPENVSKDGFTDSSLLNMVHDLLADDDDEEKGDGDQQLEDASSEIDEDAADESTHSASNSSTGCGGNHSDTSSGYFEKSDPDEISDRDDDLELENTDAFFDDNKEKPALLPTPRMLPDVYTPLEAVSRSQRQLSCGRSRYVGGKGLGARVRETSSVSSSRSRRRIGTERCSKLPHGVTVGPTFLSSRGEIGDRGLQRLSSVMPPVATVLPPRFQKKQRCIANSSRPLQPYHWVGGQESVNNTCITTCGTAKAAPELAPRLTRTRAPKVHDAVKETDAKSGKKKTTSQKTSQRQTNIKANRISVSDKKVQESKSTKDAKSHYKCNESISIDGKRNQSVSRSRTQEPVASNKSIVVAAATGGSSTMANEKGSWMSSNGDALERKEKPAVAEDGRDSMVDRSPLSLLRDLNIREPSATNSLFQYFQ